MLDGTFKPKKRVLDFTDLEIFSEMELLTFALIKLGLSSSTEMEEAARVAWQRQYSAMDNRLDEWPKSILDDGKMPYVLKREALDYVQEYPDVLLSFKIILRTFRNFLLMKLRFLTISGKSL